MITDIKTKVKSNVELPNSALAVYNYPAGLNKLAKKLVLGLLGKMSSGALEVLTSEKTLMRFGEQSGDCDTRVKIISDDFYTHCLLFGDVGLAESYIYGLCDLSSIRKVISWFLLNADNSAVLNESKQKYPVLNVLGAINKIIHFARRNSEQNSRVNIADHYDLGNEFFKAFLDPSMTYSAALYNEQAWSLEEAQQAKFERIARAVRLNGADRLLEIGCGWGAFAVYAAKTIGCSVTAITISQQQFDYVTELIVKEGLQNKIDLQLVDYRNVTGVFDKIVSIEMIEAVGDEYMNAYIRKIDSLLKRDGLLLLQMITCADSQYDSLRKNVDFIQKHIFPGSLLPSLHRVNSAMIASGQLFLVDLFDMTESYVATLEEWQRNFNANWFQISAYGFDERFRRKWNYYFEYCQAAFAMRNISSVQAVYSRPRNRSWRRDV